MFLCLLDSAIELPIQQRRTLEAACRVMVCDLLNPDFDLLEKADLLLIHRRLPPEQLKRLKSCKYIGIRAHNLDYVDMNLAQQMGIKVHGIPPVGQRAVAEHTFALIFALSKQLLLSHSNLTSGHWRENISPNLELYGKCLGIIGYGAIGKEVARLGDALGMKILVANKPGEATDGFYPFDTVLKQSDIITLHLPSNEKNRMFVDASRIAMMKPSTLLINTSRGAVLDYSSLESALSNKQLAGAGLDVFPEEPPLSGTLFDLPNVICTPHVAYYTHETLFKMNEALIHQALIHVKGWSNQ